ncbi:dynamin family protein [Anatilimnocola floriformis]|uniref:dynamin family protein n=1 Tax=Anatilimnocola floriformis TaxID=2948575 RepID=UPI0020C25194|nr:dynamin family protein [Anatilimnocola floriformis]
MQLIDQEHRRSLISWAQRIAKLATAHQQPACETAVQLAIEQFESARFRLAVLGKVKRGKSTLINALLGRSDDELAPIDKLPASSAISSFRYESQECVKVHFRDGHFATVPYGDVRSYVTEENNPENAKEVALVEIAGPFPQLDRAVELIDTPGAGSMHEHHDALIHHFTPQADAVIFLVTARMPLDQDELVLLRKLKEADVQKIFFAMNRVDESSQTDVRDAIPHNRAVLAQLDISVPKIYTISAKLAFAGDYAGSQLETLTADLRSFLTQHKGELLAERFRSRVLQAVQPWAQSLEVAIPAHASRQRNWPPI